MGRISGRGFACKEIEPKTPPRPRAATGVPQSADWVLPVAHPPRPTTGNAICTRFSSTCVIAPAMGVRQHLGLGQGERIDKCLEFPPTANRVSARQETHFRPSARPRMPKLTRRESSVNSVAVPPAFSAHVPIGTVKRNRLRNKNPFICPTSNFLSFPHARGEKIASERIGTTRAAAEYRDTATASPASRPTKAPACWIALLGTAPAEQCSERENQ